MYDLQETLDYFTAVTGPCEFLVMYDNKLWDIQCLGVTGPCEFLVMYDYNWWNTTKHWVTGPCEFLVMYDPLI